MENNNLKQFFFVLIGFDEQLEQGIVAFFLPFFFF